MQGLMMEYQLTLPPLLQRAEMLFGDKEIVTRLPDKSFHRYTYRDLGARSKQLAAALKKAGLEEGDRVATLCWNHYQHYEAYFGIPCGGFVLHTLNLRLSPGDIAYVAKHAGDRAVIVDQSLLPLLEKFKDETDIEHVFVVEDSYEDLLGTATPEEWEDPRLDEREAAAMCYTSGTTGRCKGVVYTHRSTVLHALGVASISPLGPRRPPPAPPPPAGRRRGRRARGRAARAGQVRPVGLEAALVQIGHRHGGEVHATVDPHPGEQRDDENADHQPDDLAQRR
jgi:fatty-acyl-CoA synthase